MKYNDPKIAEFRENVGKLIEAEELKRYVDDTCAMYERLQHRERSVLLNRVILLSIAEGDGLETWIRTLAKMWTLLLGEDVVTKYYQLRLPELADAENAKKMTERDIVLHTITEDDILDYYGSFRIMCIDITKWEDRIEGAEFRAVLARIKQKNKNQLIVFRLPAVDEINLRRVKQAIGWFHNVDELSCTPYSISDYVKYGLDYLEKKGIETEEGVEEELREIIAVERRSRFFCGFKTVRCILDELIFSTLRRHYGYKEA